MSGILKWSVIIIIVISVLLLNAYVVITSSLPFYYFFIILAAIIIVPMILRYIFSFIMRMLGKRKETVMSSSYQASAETRKNIHHRIKSLTKQWQRMLEVVKKDIYGSQSDTASFSWYLMIGKKDAGKTSALKNSGEFNSIKIEMPDGTNDIHIWYGHKTIIIDTPGDYLHDSDPASLEEWNTLLGLIAKNKKDISFKGVLLCLSVDDFLKQNNKQAQSDYEILLSKRLSTIGEKLHLKCPVYVLATQCDKIYGMSGYGHSLPDYIRNQGLGAFNYSTVESGINNIVQATVNALYQVMSDMRLLVTGSDNILDNPHEVFIFPEEFKSIGKKINVFLSAVFKDQNIAGNPYFRALYICSATQGDSSQKIYSEQFGQGGGHATNNYKGEYSLFLQGFFTEVLQQDHAPIVATDYIIKKNIFINNLAITSWLGLCLFTAIFLTYSFSRNISILSELSKQMPESLRSNNELFSDIDMMNKFKLSIDYIEGKNNENIMPAFALNQSNTVEKSLKTIYTGRVKDIIFTKVDRYLDLMIRSVDEESPAEEIAANIEFIVRRLTLAGHAGLDDGYFDVTRNAGLKLPNFSVVTDIPDVRIQEELNSKLKLNYLSYLKWHDNPKVIDIEIEDDKERIFSLLLDENIGFDWITDWANRQVAGKNLDLASFWSGRRKLDSEKEIFVKKVYSPEGWALIKGFLDEIGTANSNSEFIRKRDDYYRGYAAEYIAVWKYYLLRFHEGYQKWGLNQREELAKVFSTSQSPYSKVIFHTADSMEPVFEIVADTDSLPSWLMSIKNYKKIINNELDVAAVGSGLSHTVGAIVDEVVRSSSKGGSKFKINIADKKASFEYLKQYNESLASIIKHIPSAEASFTLAKNVFDENSISITEPKELMNQNSWYLDQLRSTINNDDLDNNDLLILLLKHQSEEVWRLVLAQAGKYIQSMWLNDVVSYADGLTGWDHAEATQGFDGKAWSFYADFLASFINKLPGNKYQIRSLYNGSVDFNNKFLALLRKGRMSKNALTKKYRIEVTSIPTDTNRGASVKPHETRLLIQCADDVQEIINRNFTTTKTISWIPLECDEVALQISVGSQILRWKYKGYDAIIKFIDDFSSGRKTFRRSQFPDKSGYLSGYGIEKIIVKFNFSGKNKILRLKGRRPSGFPERIINR